MSGDDKINGKKSLPERDERGQFVNSSDRAGVARKKGILN